jgi:hypothetical protein
LSLRSLFVIPFFVFAVPRGSKVFPHPVIASAAGARQSKKATGSVNAGISNPALSRESTNWIASSCRAARRAALAAAACAVLAKTDCGETALRVPRSSAFPQGFLFM